MSDASQQNHFQRFGLEPRPSIDQQLLKERFLQLSAETHPDKAAAGEKTLAERSFTDLNESYNTLRHTRSRLLHLLELHGDPKPQHTQDVPPSALELFPEVAAATRSADDFLRRKAAADSPMLQVQLMAEGMDELEKIQQLQGRIRAKIDAIEAELRQIADGWAGTGADVTLKPVREAAAALGFLERWNTQLQERAARLTF